MLIAEDCNSIIPISKKKKKKERPNSVLTLDADYSIKLYYERETLAKSSPEASSPFGFASYFQWFIIHVMGWGSQILPNRPGQANLEMLFIATGQANFAMLVLLIIRLFGGYIYRDDKKMKFCIRTKLRPTKKKTCIPVYTIIL